MAGIIIFEIISLMVSLIFVILGVTQYRSEIPVSLNTGEKPPKKDELLDMKKWNQEHGRNLIIFGCMLFVSASVFRFFLDRLDCTMGLTGALLLVVCGGIVWLEIRHNHLKEKLIKK